MWLSSLLGIQLILNDRRRPKAALGTRGRAFTRAWWVHSRAARRRLNERQPHPGVMVFPERT